MPISLTQSFKEIENFRTQKSAAKSLEDRIKCYIAYKPFFLGIQHHINSGGYISEALSEFSAYKNQIQGEIKAEGSGLEAQYLSLLHNKSKKTMSKKEKIRELNTLMYQFSVLLHHSTLFNVKPSKKLVKYKQFHDTITSFNQRIDQLLSNYSSQQFASKSEVKEFLKEFYSIKSGLFKASLMFFPPIFPFSFKESKNKVKRAIKSIKQHIKSFNQFSEAKQELFQAINLLEDALTKEIYFLPQGKVLALHTYKKFNTHHYFKKDIELYAILLEKLNAGKNMLIQQLDEKLDYAPISISELEQLLLFFNKLNQSNISNESRNKIHQKLSALLSIRQAYYDITKLYNKLKCEIEKCKNIKIKLQHNTLPIKEIQSQIVALEDYKKIKALDNQGTVEPILVQPTLLYNQLCEEYITFKKELSEMSLALSKKYANIPFSLYVEELGFPEDAHLLAMRNIVLYETNREKMVCSILPILHNLSSMKQQLSQDSKFWLQRFGYCLQKYLPQKSPEFAMLISQINSLYSSECCMHTSSTGQYVNQVAA